MASASDLRRDQDQEGLISLINRSQGELSSEGKLNCRASRVTLRLALPTLATHNLPLQWEPFCLIEILLPLRYPFEPPSARVLSKLWHPNVFMNGNICLGSRWQATEGLDLFIARIARLLVFDPMLVNLNSVAHQAAAHWYRSALHAYPQAFPSVRPSATHWLLDPRGSNALAPRTVKACPSCSAQLRLPEGRSGVVQCPRCRNDFEVKT
jgi:Ubiquitin-conjugating enzyme